MNFLKFYLVTALFIFSASCSEKQRGTRPLTPPLSGDGLGAAKHAAELSAKNVFFAKDFVPDTKAPVLYYYDEKNNAFAINAAKMEMREGFAGAVISLESEHAGQRKLILVSLAEVDGESEYRIIKNGDLLASFRNPETKTDYSKIEFETPLVELRSGDKIRVESNADTNGKIPEGDGTAYSRGRWVKLILK